MKHLKLKQNLGLIATALMMVSSGTSMAQETNPSPMQLKRVMQDLSRHMQTTTDAIAREDWETVVRLAPLIAKHEEPPASEKLRILSFLGADAARFRQMDHMTHEAADQMRQAALKKDGIGVIQSYAKVQNACFACHNQFRQKFVDKFYGVK